VDEQCQPLLTVGFVARRMFYATFELELQKARSDATDRQYYMKTLPKLLCIRRIKKMLKIDKYKKYRGL